MLKLYSPILRVLCLFVFVAAWSGCDSTVPIDDRYPGFYGKVVNEQGIPVANARIHYIPRISPPASASCFTPPDFVLIEYDVVETSPVLVALLHFPGGETVTELVNTTQNPGNYVAPFATAPLSSGPYIVRLQIGSDVYDVPYLLVKSAESQRTTPPLAETNTAGEFTLDFESLGIGENFVKPGPGGLSDCAGFVTSIVDLVVSASGYPTVVLPVNAGNLLSAVDVEITLETQ